MLNHNPRKILAGSVFTVCLIALAPAIDAAQLHELTPACETALAESALPVYLRDQASVYVLGEKGFEAQAQGDAAFHCIVARNHADSLIPQCFDEPGTTAILPKFLAEGKLIRSGLRFEAIRKKIDEQLQDGVYDKKVDRPGLVYMMSAYNYIFAGRRAEVVHVHPHVMFHAPNLRPEQVGNTLPQGLQNHGLPFVIDAGVHGYMIAMVDKASDSGAVNLACAGQLPDAPPKL